ncbi:MAG: hypothetical protein HYY23_13060 [Verrucomicrobia bacterium]|nr:hypothetical protein [Verrucomicrobiota bacterium]
MYRPIRNSMFEESAAAAALGSEGGRGGTPQLTSKRRQANRRSCSPKHARVYQNDVQHLGVCAQSASRGARWLIFVLVCAYQVNNAAQEPVIAEPSPTAVAKASASFKPAVGRNAPDILDHRLAYYATNYFTLHNLIGPFQEALEQRTVSSEILGEPMANVMKRAGREAAREIALRSMRAEDLLESLFPERLRDAIYYSLLDRIDLGKLRDPFNPSEGVPGTERSEPGRFPRHASLQFRPFRTDPAVLATIRSRDVDIGLRASVKEAGLVTQIPLGHSWVATQGLKCEDYDGKLIHASFGVSKIMKNGYFTAAIRMPVIANAPPENQMQILFALQKRF